MSKSAITCDQKKRGFHDHRHAAVFGACLLMILFLMITAGCEKKDKVISNLADAQNARIGAMVGSIGEMLAKTRFPQAEIKSFDDTMDAVAALKSGQLDAVLTVLTTTINVVKRNPDLTYVPETIEKENVSIAVRKGNEALLKQVDGVIAKLRQDGTLADMSKRWFKLDPSPYETVVINTPAEGIPLKVGTNATREPFAFVDAAGKQTGHDGELAYRIGASLKRPVEFYDMKFAALIPALQAGKVDLIISGMSATEERKKSVDFSQPYYENTYVLIVKKPGRESYLKGIGESKTPKMATMDDIADKRVGIKEGTIYDAYLQKNYPNAKIFRYMSYADLILALKNGKVDAILEDDALTFSYLMENPELGQLADQVMPMPMGVAFNKDNPALRNRFNLFLKSIREDGIYDEMVQRWMKTDTEKVIMPDIPMAQSAEKLVLGIANNILPFTAMKNGEFVGFDIEIMKRFAAHEGVALEIKVLEFSSLIAALASGKLDLVASSFSITEERQKQVDFSEPYAYSTGAIVALKSSLAGYEDGDLGAVERSFFKDLGNSFYSNIILENRYLLILDGLKTTLVISLLSGLFGTLLGGLICFMRMSRRRALSWIAKVYISILRGTPVLVLLMLIFYVIFASVDINPILVAVLAFGMNFAAYGSEMFRTGIEGVERGQTEAGIAMGFSRVRTFLHIVAPQTLRRILPVYKGEVISMVKMTSIVGYIAVQDLTKASDIIRSRTFDAFFPLIMVAILYFAISGLLILLLDYIEGFTDPKRRRG